MTWAKTVLQLLLPEKNISSSRCFSRFTESRICKCPFAAAFVLYGLEFCRIMLVCAYTKFLMIKYFSKKVPHSARLTSKRNVLSIYGLVLEQMGIWNGLQPKKWHDLKIGVHPYPITKRVLSRRSFDSWAIKRWWTSWRPHWVVSHHLLREKSWSHHFLNCHVLHKLQMTIK